jgi:hypothetical protein
MSITITVVNKYYVINILESIYFSISVLDIRQTESNSYESEELLKFAVSE